MLSSYISSPLDRLCLSDQTGTKSLSHSSSG
jgi:hypothetical protein